MTFCSVHARPAGYIKKPSQAVTALLFPALATQRMFPPSFDAKWGRKNQESHCFASASSDPRPKERLTTRVSPVKIVVPRPPRTIDSNARVINAPSRSPEPALHAALSIITVPFRPGIPRSMPLFQLLLFAAAAIPVIMVPCPETSLEDDVWPCWPSTVHKS